MALITYGADVNATNINFETPLHLAAAVNDREIYRILVESGAHETIVNDSYETPLDMISQFPADMLTRVQEEE
jgi:ankyrin repeat protein